MNFYRYAANNPVSFSDPFGLQQQPQQPPDHGWFWNWLNRWFNAFMAPPQPRPGDKQIPPENWCNAGDLRLFYESGPNPVAENGKYQSAWQGFQSQFVRRCEAAQTNGKSTYPICRSGATIFGGGYALCQCCEHCEQK